MTIEPLNELGKQFKATSNAKGFTDGALSRQDLIEKCMLIVCEVAEAIEEIRKGHHPCDTYYKELPPTKPEGFPTEMADVLIRTLQLCASLGIDVDKAVADKHAYNNTRPFKHGKAF